MRLLFIRHGESTGNLEHRLQGRAEFDLSDEGRRQAERLHQRLQGEGLEPTHVYSSPQRRAAQTAEIAARSWQAPVRYWDDLMEIDVGIFSGLTWAEIEARYPDVARKHEQSRDWSVVEGVSIAAGLAC